MLHLLWAGFLKMNFTILQGIVEQESFCGTSLKHIIEQGPVGYVLEYLNDRIQVMLIVFVKCKLQTHCHKKVLHILKINRNV